MAGRGPAPKAGGAARHRSHPASTRAALPGEVQVVADPTKVAPPLHDRPCPECSEDEADKKRRRACARCAGKQVLPWHPRTQALWVDVWASPMRAEFAQADVHGLYILAELVDRFWTTGSLDVAKEIRLELEKYGLTPLARRSLQWKLPKQAEQPAQAEAAAPEQAGEDPRKVLRMAPRSA